MTDLIGELNAEIDLMSLAMGTGAPLPLAYAGIGSRETPREFLRPMTELAKTLRSMGWTLRTGHAKGADLAFEFGARDRAEVYLPWASFNGHVRPLARYVQDEPTHHARSIAPSYHGAWSRLSERAQSLHARNVHQVLGRDCRPSERVRMVVCWTPEGRGTGGTGQAIRIARDYGVPVFDLANRGALADALAFAVRDA